MKLHLLRVGRGRTAWADAGFEEYARRLQRTPLQEQLLRPEPFRGQVEPVQAAEGGRILAEIRAGDLLIALDERGKLPSTEEFAGWIEEAMRLQTKRLVFAIGGPYGHGPAVRERAWRSLALSRMVLNHELARVLLAEQLYRVSTLLWGGSYHH